MTIRAGVGETDLNREIWKLRNIGVEIRQGAGREGTVAGGDELTKQKHDSKEGHQV